jgi:hypothetical protein
LYKSADGGVQSIVPPRTTVNVWPAAAGKRLGVAMH